MNAEYVGTINNQKLTIKMLFVEAFFMEPFFTNWVLHTFTTLFFCRNFEEKNYIHYCQRCDSLYDRRFYRAIGCGRGLHPNLKKKNRLQNS